MSLKSREKILLKIIRNSEKLTLEEMRNHLIEIKDQDILLWFDFLKCKSFIKRDVNSELFYIERFQHFDWHNLSNTNGKRISAYKNIKQINTKFCQENISLFKKYLYPITEEIKSGKFEIICGHHRTLAFIRKNYSKINTIVIVKRNNTEEMKACYFKTRQILKSYRTRLNRKIRRFYTSQSHNILNDKTCQV